MEGFTNNTLPNSFELKDNSIEGAKNVAKSEATFVLGCPFYNFIRDGFPSLS
jgi:hypothetical protein